MTLLSEIEQYHPYNQQETEDKLLILNHLKHSDNVFYRKNKIAHMTASAWVVNPTRDKVLMVYHNIYNSWSWMGGHADGDKDLFSVAIKEVKEESGLSDLTAISRDIFSLEVLTVDGHEKNSAYVPSHLHLNITYLFEADDTAPIFSNPDENSDVAWFQLDEAIKVSSEPWFRERIYAKLNAQLK